jgi:GNAT superfamily N-acetyltransferase
MGVAVPRGGELVVREATEDDRHTLATLWVTLASQANEPAPDKSGAPPKIFVAELDAQVVGMVAVGCEPVAPVAGVCALEITELHVRGGYEHCRVGSVLIAAAATEADRLGCDHVLMTISATGSSGRLLASRMGFGAARRRLTPVVTMRRRLGLEAGAGDSRLARRRAVLRRTPVLPPALPQDAARRV